jgi:hypothetical protein
MRLASGGGVSLSDILSEYTVMQQNEWAGRRFYTAHSHRTGQVVYLVAVPAQDPLALYQHSSLPRLEPVGLEGQTRWLAGPVPEEDTLEDLRSRSMLSESDLVSGLLTVLDGMASLSQLQAAPVPAYLDPACIKRDRLGRWTLDYLALAHAPEARSAGGSPPGVYAFGVLLYWLITGETMRLARVQAQRIEGAAPTGLQYIVVKCLGRSYKSLAELRADIAQAGQDHEFRRLVRGQPEALKRPVDTELHRIQLGGPQIPMNDRPWALPPRPAEGYRKYIVPPPPNPLTVKVTRWGALALVAVVTMALTAAAFIKSGVIPPELILWQTRQTSSLMPDPAPPPVTPSESDTAPVAGPVAGPPAPNAAEPAKNAVAQQPPAPKPQPSQPVPQPKPQPEPPKPTTKPAPKPTPNPLPPAPQPTPTPPAQTPPAPPAPVEQPHPQPAAGSEDYKDAVQGALPVLIYYNNNQAGWAWIFPHLANPYISVGTFNRLFGQNILWMPVDGGGVRLLNGGKNLITTDYELVNNRLWLKLTPFLQQALGVKPTTYDETGMYFVTFQ